MGSRQKQTSKWSIRGCLFDEIPRYLSMIGEIGCGISVVVG